MAASDFRQRAVKVTGSDGESWKTEINGTIPEVRAYFRFGKVFNIGRGEHDHMVRVTGLEFIDEASKADLRGSRRRSGRPFKFVRSRR